VLISKINEKLVEFAKALYNMGESDWKAFEFEDRSDLKPGDVPHEMFLKQEPNMIINLRRVFHRIGDERTCKFLEHIWPHYESDGSLVLNPFSKLYPKTYIIEPIRNVDDTIIESVNITEIYKEQVLGEKVVWITETPEDMNLTNGEWLAIGKHWGVLEPERKWINSVEIPMIFKLLKCKIFELEIMVDFLSCLTKEDLVEEALTREVSKDILRIMYNKWYNHQARLDMDIRTTIMVWPVFGKLQKVVHSD